MVNSSELPSSQYAIFVNVLPLSPMRSMGEHVDERLYELGMSQADLSRSSGISYDTIRRIVSGRGEAVRSSTARKLEVALNWQQGSIAAILNGGEPTVLATDGPATGMVIADDDHVTDGGGDEDLGDRMDRLERMIANLAQTVHINAAASGLIEADDETKALLARLAEQRLAKEG